MRRQVSFRGRSDFDRIMLLISVVVVAGVPRPHLRPDPAGWVGDLASSLENFSTRAPSATRPRPRRLLRAAAIPTRTPPPHRVNARATRRQKRRRAPGTTSETSTRCSYTKKPGDNRVFCVQFSSSGVELAMQDRTEAEGADAIPARATIFPSLARAEPAGAFTTLSAPRRDAWS